MPTVRTTASEYFSCLLSSSRLNIILIINMEIIINTAHKYQVNLASGFRKISSLILFDVVDSSRKQGL